MDARKKIMVVDDDNDIVESIAMILESAGYKVTAADSGEQCLEFLRCERPDLIILDVMMETMTEGFNVSYDLKNNPDFQTIPIIIVSSIEDYAGIRVDKDFVMADEFLEKPLHPNILLETIKRLL
ncbi:response regulator [bacterium]|nr:response regulator [bacterium]